MNSGIPASLEKWETTRKLGRARYVLFRGVIGWGIPVGVFTTCFGIWRSGYSFSSLVIAALVWPVAGIFVGRINWRVAEGRYLRFHATRSPMPNQLPDPTSPSVTPPAGQESRHCWRGSLGR